MSTASCLASYSWLDTVGLVRFLFYLRTETQAPSNGFVFNQRESDDRNVKYRRKRSVKRAAQGGPRGRDGKRQKINKRRNRHVNHSSIYVQQLATMVNKEKDYRKEMNGAKGKI